MGGGVGRVATAWDLALGFLVVFLFARLGGATTEGVETRLRGLTCVMKPSLVWAGGR
jgi:hypothetical protein